MQIENHKEEVPFAHYEELFRKLDPAEAASRTGAKWDGKVVHVMEDAYIASYDVALQKAYTVVALKMSTMDLKPLAQPGASLYGIQFTNDGQIVIFGGGEPLKIGDRIIGGLGVSGGSEEQDAALAAFGADFFARLVKNAYL